MLGVPCLELDGAADLNITITDISLTAKCPHCLKAKTKTLPKTGKSVPFKFRHESGCPVGRAIAAHRGVN